MNIVTLMGSPRRHGNTATVLAAFEQKVAGQHAIERINVRDYDLHGCLGCNYCQRHFESARCAQKDDANAIFERMMGADLLVYAAPMYMWDFSAQLKTLMDRHYCLTKWRNSQVEKSYLAGKQAMLLVTCGAGIEENADVIQVIFRREMECTGCEVAGIFILPDCGTPKETATRVGPIVEDMMAALTADF